MNYGRSKNRRLLRKPSAYGNFGDRISRARASQAERGDCWSRDSGVAQCAKSHSRQRSIDHLASAASTAQKDALPQALERLQASLVRNPLLIVVSTRSNVLPQLIKGMPDGLANACLERVSLRWLNVTADDLEPYFRWSEMKSSETAAS